MKKLIAILSVYFVINTIYAQHQNFEKTFFPDRVDYSYRNISLASSNTDNYDLKYYRFDIKVDPLTNYISGSVTPRYLVTKDNTNEIYFDFNSVMIVDSVRYHGQMLPSSFSSQYELKIDLPQAMVKGDIDSIKIWYRGNPTTSGFGSFEIGSQYCDQSKKLLWTLSEPYGARDWWPTKQSLNDKIDSIDMFVTTPKGYKVGSNGLLISVEDMGDQLVHHWKHNYPEPAYLIAIAVSDYNEYIDWVPLENGDSLKVLEYVFPCNIDYAKQNTPNIIPIIQFYIKLFGEYPFSKEKYGHAQFGWGGGMEHSTMTFISSFGHSLMAHELAHQWFGDKITCGSWQDIWLNEGFATYLEGLTYDFGRDPSSWNNWKGNNQSRALSQPDGSVFVDDTTSVGRIFSGSLSYSKGAYLLHMLRWKLGDDNFFQALRNYITDPKLEYNYARTTDLQKHLEIQSGMDLNEFFNDWFYGKGYPTYSFDWWHQTDGKVVVKVLQTQSNSSVDFFEMPVPIQLKGEGKDTIVVMDNTVNEETFTFDVDFKVDQLVLDPDKWLCAKQSQINYLKIDSPINSNSFAVFPNPATDRLNIFLNGKAYINDIYLIDLSGAKAFRFTQNLRTDILELNLNTNGLNSGLYLIKLITEDGVMFQKIYIDTRN